MVLPMPGFPAVDCGLLVAIYDPAATEIVGRELYDDAVFRKDPDVVLTHLARDMREHDVPVFQLDTKHCIRQGLGDRAFYFDDAFFRHVPR